VVAEKLRASIEALCDKLKDNPNVAENMAKVASERQSLQALLSMSLEQLQSMHKIPCITEMVMAEHFRRREIKEVVEREKTAARAVSTLRMDLKDEKEDHDKVWLIWCCSLCSFIFLEPRCMLPQIIASRLITSLN
jgi:rubrerythrin